jgi:hypothetical protein
MTTILLFLAVALVLGVAFVLIELKNAPEGYQTDEGFEVAWKNNSPDREDVSCVWIPSPGKVA